MSDIINPRFSLSRKEDSSDQKLFAWLLACVSAGSKEHENTIFLKIRCGGFSMLQTRSSPLFPVKNLAEEGGVMGSCPISGFKRTSKSQFFKNAFLEVSWCCEFESEWASPRGLVRRRENGSCGRFLFLGSKEHFSQLSQKTCFKGFFDVENTVPETVSSETWYERDH